METNSVPSINKTQRLIHKGLSFFFNQLYHTFAWTYDAVAFLVSFGNWENWVISILPELEGPIVLELGHGPGHLQKALIDMPILSIGLDESHQMGQMSVRNIKKDAKNSISDKNDPYRLIRSKAQAIPLPASTINTIAATFPSQYILDPQTLLEMQRVLVPGGKLVVLLGVDFVGKTPASLFLQLLYHITGQRISTEIIESFISRINKFQFEAAAQWKEYANSKLLIITAQKKTL